VDLPRKNPTVWRTVATIQAVTNLLVTTITVNLPPYPPPVATRCQAVDLPRKNPTVWRTVATIQAVTTILVTTLTVNLPP
jgi:hypothetical protein